jgi:multiple sugar transport system substrate-binding protein
MIQDQRFPTSFSRRRFLQYTGSAALGSSFLAACAGGSAGGGTPTNSSLPSLTQWYHQYGEAGTHQAVLKYAQEYSKTANVTVDWVAGTGNAYPDAVRAALLGSNAPDVFELPSIGLDQVKANLLEPLDDIIASVKSDFKAASLAPFTVNGHVYGIKMINDPTFIYYRKSMFQKANLQIPTTIDELIAAAKKLTSGNVKGIYVGSDSGVTALYEMIVWSTGAELLNADNTQVTYNTARIAAAYEKLYELNTSGGVLPSAPTDWTDSTTFQQGLVAMQWCGLWAMPLIKAGPVGDDFDVFPFPAFDAQGTPATIDGGWAELVSAKSKNVQAAKDYVKWLWITNTAIQTDWNVGYGFHIPPRISASAAAAKLKTGQAANAVDILNKYGHAISPYWDAKIDLGLQNAASSIAKTGKNALSVLNQAADQANAELQTLNG